MQYPEQSEMGAQTTACLFPFSCVSSLTHSLYLSSVLTVLKVYQFYTESRQQHRPPHETRNSFSGKFFQCETSAEQKKCVGLSSYVVLGSCSHHCPLADTRT